MAGIFSDRSLGGFKGLRNEIIYSRQGFHFSNANTSGTVDLQYIFFSNLVTFNFGDVVQLQVGPQVGYLAKAFADTVNKLINTNVSRLFSITKETNRLNYGACIGLEIYPWRGSLIGARYNISFISLNKKDNDNSSFTSSTRYTSVSYQDNDARLKNEVIQIFVGWRFGNGINRKK